MVKLEKPLHLKNLNLLHLNMRISRIIILDNQNTPLTWEFLRLRDIPEMNPDILGGALFNQGLMFYTGIVENNEYIDIWKIHIINNI